MDIKFGFGRPNEFPDMQGSAAVAELEEMSITADASKGQCRPPDSSLLHISSLNIKSRLIPAVQTLLVLTVCVTARLLVISSDSDEMNSLSELWV